MKESVRGFCCVIEHTRCNENTCMHNGICIEKIGGFRCRCEKGYKGQRCEGQSNRSRCPEVFYKKGVLRNLHSLQLYEKETLGTSVFV